MPDAHDLLARLRDPAAGAAADRLAALLVEDALGRTLVEIAPPAAVAEALRDGLRALTASDAAEARIVRDAEEAMRELGAHKGPVDDLVPPALAEGLRELVQLRAEPKRDAVLKLLDRDPLRAILRAQVVDTLIAFGRKAASPVADNAIARGIGGLGKLALGQLASRPSPLGSLANAVSGEVERQVEKRATDFADTAVAGILEGLADQVSNPARAAEQAAVRLALLDGFLELSGADLAELTQVNVGARVKVVRKAAAAWVADPAFLTDATALLTKLAAKDAGRTLREILDDLGLTDTVRTHARATAKRWIEAVVATDAFAAWVASLFA
jgi:hypothetical protein